MNGFIQEGCTDQRLIATTTRGGLKAVNVEIQQIFVIADETFGDHTSGAYHISKVNIELIINQLMMDTSLISMYNSLIVDETINTEVKHSLLENLLKLYIRVRAFTFAKDITNKHKYLLKKSKSKALRKDIKKATEKTEISK